MNYVALQQFQGATRVIGSKKTAPGGQDGSWTPFKTASKRRKRAVFNVFSAGRKAHGRACNTHIERTRMHIGEPLQAP